MSEQTKDHTELIDRYHLGQITGEELERLEEALRTDEAFRKTFAAASRVDSNLRDFSQASLVTWQSEPRPTRQIFWSVSAAAALLVVGLVAWRVGASGATSTPMAAPVAQLVAATNAEWSDQSPQLDRGLAAGSYTLQAGTAELTMMDGVKISVKAPISFELKSVYHLHLISGNLVARIPGEALGFLVTTPQSEVVDLGTEFGLSVNAKGHTDVHVIDGLVEVFGRESAAGSEWPAGVKVEQGQAKRFGANAPIADLSFSTRQEILGGSESNARGFTLLRGGIRVKTGGGKTDLMSRQTGRHWIEVVPEKKAVVLTSDVTVSMTEPGHYRNFTQQIVVPAGTRVDSYLLHFLPTSYDTIRGVVAFDHGIVGIVCVGEHLRASDSIVGLAGVQYPEKTRYRGLEPYSDVPNPNPSGIEVWLPDQVTVGQDRRTLGLRVNGNPERGVDQIRVLVKSAP